MVNLIENLTKTLSLVFMALDFILLAPNFKLI
jgi:hypothetical protein